MNVFRSRYGYISLLAAGIFALFLLAGCGSGSSSSGAQPNSTTLEAYSSMDSIGNAIDQALADNGVTVMSPAGGIDVKTLQQRLRNLVLLSNDKAGGFIPLMAFAGTYGCSVSGTIAISGSADFVDGTDPSGYGTVTVTLTNVTATFTNCSDGIYELNGTVTLNVNDSITVSAGSGVDIWDFSINEGFSGNITSKKVATGQIYTISFNYSTTGSLTFETDYISTFNITALNFNFTITVNGQTCSGKVTLANPDGTFSCSG